MSRPLLRVVGSAGHGGNGHAAQAKADEEKQAREQASNQFSTELAGFIRGQFDVFKRHRDQSQAGWSNRLLAALRVFNGEYDPEKLSDIQKFGGSEVYARVVAMKCRGASSLLRDVYLSPDRALER